MAYKGVGFGLLDEFVDEYEGLIRFLLAQGTWGEKFSEKYMELALRKLIVAVLGEAAEGGDLNRAASKQVEALVAELDASFRRANLLCPRGWPQRGQGGCLRPSGSKDALIL